MGLLDIYRTYHHAKNPVSHVGLGSSTTEFRFEQFWVKTGDSETKLGIHGNIPSLGAFQIYDLASNWISGVCHVVVLRSQFAGANELYDSTYNSKLEVHEDLK